VGIDPQSISAPIVIVRAVVMVIAMVMVIVIVDGNIYYMTLTSVDFGIQMCSVAGARLPLADVA
jgi:hypothetical protein